MKERAVLNIKHHLEVVISDLFQYLISFLKSHNYLLVRSPNLRI